MLKFTKYVILGLMLVAAFAGFTPVATAQTSSQTIPVALLSFLSALSPDGKLLAIAADNNIYNNKVEDRLLPIHLIDIASGQETAQLQGVQTDFTTGLAFTPNGKQLISLHGNGQLNLWDVSKGSLVKSRQLPGLRFSLPHFFANGKQLALLDSTIPAHILILDIDSGAITASFGPLFKSYDELQQGMTGIGMGDFSYRSFAVSPDGKLLVAATLNDEVDIWNIATGKMSILTTPPKKSEQLNIRPMVFMPDSKTLVYYHRNDNKLHIWDVSTGTEQSISVTGGGNFALSAKGDQVAWIDKLQVFVWDFKSSQPQKLADLDAKFKANPNGSLYFTPDAKSVIIAATFTSDEQNQIDVIPVSASKP